MIPFSSIFENIKIKFISIEYQSIRSQLFQHPKHIVFSFMGQICPYTSRTREACSSPLGFTNRRFARRTFRTKGESSQLRVQLHCAPVTAYTYSAVLKGQLDASGSQRVSSDECRLYPTISKRLARPSTWLRPLFDCPFPEWHQRHGVSPFEASTEFSTLSYVKTWLTSLFGQKTYLVFSVQPLSLPIRRF